MLDNKIVKEQAIKAKQQELYNAIMENDLFKVEKFIMVPKNWTTKMIE